MTAAVLVSGGDYAAREAAIAAHLAGLSPASSQSHTAVILEGLPSGQPLLQASANLDVQRIAPGCVCCIGNLAMRVTLNRLLRKRPALLLVGLADAGHLEQARAFLSQPPYDNLLDWQTEISL